MAEPSQLPAPEPTAPPGATQPPASRVPVETHSGPEWLALDPDLAPWADLFKAYYGIASLQFMDRATLDQRLLDMPDQPMPVQEIANRLAVLGWTPSENQGDPKDFAKWREKRDGGESDSGGADDGRRRDRPQGRGGATPDGGNKSRRAARSRNADPSDDRKAGAAGAGDADDDRDRKAGA